MFLILDVTSPNAVSLGAAARMVFSRQGGSIGRRPGNEWVLPDAHVSGRHARIRAMGGTFFLEDNESGNGVLVNGNRIHAGEPFPLKDGDVIFIDPFEIVARLSATVPASAEAPPVAPPGISQAIAAGMAHAYPPTGAPRADVPTGGLDDLIGLGASAIPESNPLLDPPSAPPPRQIPAGVDLMGKSILNDALTIATPASTMSPPISSPVIPAVSAPLPGGGGAIPTNWDLSDLGLTPGGQGATPPAPPPPPVVIPGFMQLGVPASPAIPPVAAAPAAVPSYVPPLQATAVPPMPTQAVMPGPVAVSSAATSDLVEVLRAAGLDVNSIDPQVAAQLGRVLRTVVAGLMEVLRARGEIKGEFRLQQTTFKPRENNPLKFSANVEDALHNLLVKRNAAYLDTPSAFVDAFDDVRNHQVAMLAGMRAAFDDMLARFDPSTLAAQFDAKPGRKLSIGLGAGGRHWESFGEYYKDMTRDADDCFRRLFGDQFARAYEEQLQRLKAEGRRS